MTEKKFEIKDEAPRTHFTIIPNIVDDMGLSPVAYRLYGHLKRIAGETGKCWRSTRTLAKECNMSIGSVSNAKEELKGTDPPLIRITQEGHTPSHVIYITDIWGVNRERYVHNMNASNGGGCSYYEPIKNPLRRTPQGKEKKGDLVDGMVELSRSPGIKKVLRIEYILSEIGQTLVIDTSGREWESFARFVDDKQQNEDQGLDVFLKWLTSKPNFDPQFWPPKKMRTMWPQAFQSGKSTPSMPAYKPPDNEPPIISPEKIKKE